MAGLDVAMVDISTEAIEKGRRTIASSLDRLVKKEKVKAGDRDAMLARVSGSTDYETLRGADLVIEAATENVALKLKILKQIDGLIGKDTLIATNTSSISITQLAAVMSRPGDFIGLHFFNPAPVMDLVEVIHGLATTPQTIERATAFARQLGKKPVMVRNAPGFIVNRLLCPMINEAVFVLAEGVATAQDIDESMKLGCGHPIGPLALADMIGLDVVLAVMDVFVDSFQDPKYRPAPLLREMVVAGRLGRKSGQGFHKYD